MAPWSSKGYQNPQCTVRLDLSLSHRWVTAWSSKLHSCKRKRGEDGGKSWGHLPLGQSHLGAPSCKENPQGEGAEREQGGAWSELLGTPVPFAVRVLVGSLWEGTLPCLPRDARVPNPQQLSVCGGLCPFFPRFSC